MEPTFHSLPWADLVEMLGYVSEEPLRALLHRTANEWLRTHGIVDLSAGLALDLIRDVLLRAPAAPAPLVRELFWMARFMFTDEIDVVRKERGTSWSLDREEVRPGDAVVRAGDEDPDAREIARVVWAAQTFTVHKVNAVTSPEERTQQLERRLRDYYEARRSGAPVRVLVHKRGVEIWIIALLDTVQPPCAVEDGIAVHRQDRAGRGAAIILRPSLSEVAVCCADEGEAAEIGRHAVELLGVPEAGSLSAAEFSQAVTGARIALQLPPDRLQELAPRAVYLGERRFPLESVFIYLVQRSTRQSIDATASHAATQLASDRPGHVLMLALDIPNAEMLQAAKKRGFRLHGLAAGADWDCRKAAIDALRDEVVRRQINSFDPPSLAGEETRLILDPASNRAFVRDGGGRWGIITCTPLQWRYLQVLTEHAGKPIPFLQVLQRVYPREYGGRPQLDPSGEARVDKFRHRLKGTPLHSLMTVEDRSIRVDLSPSQIAWTSSLTKNSPAEERDVRHGGKATGKRRK